MSYNVQEMIVAQELVKAINKMLAFEMTPSRRFDLERLKKQWQVVAATGSHRVANELQIK